MNQIPTGPICQSCSMPMQKPADFGGNADGTKNEDYCCYCWQKGEFTDPTISMDRMIDKVAQMMSEMQGISEDHTLEMCVHYIPRLKRWRK